MNHTKKTIVKKITRDFGSQIQNHPRKRKKHAKKLFSDGMIRLHTWQLESMLTYLGRANTIEIPVGLGKS